MILLQRGQSLAGSFREEARLLARQEQFKSLNKKEVSEPARPELVTSFPHWEQTGEKRLALSSKLN